MIAKNMFNINKPITNLLEGKRIAIVGPSPHLLEKGFGHKIDEYDLVCRVNDIVETKFSADYGKENDIIFYSCSTLWLNNFALKLKRRRELEKN